jgi:hypothetical protein
MKKIKVTLIIFWISILLMVLISAVSSHPVIHQDPVKQDSVKKKIDIKQKQDPSKLTDLERKKLEYLEWQKRSKQIDKSMDQLDKQSMKMDSIILKSKKK